MKKQIKVFLLLLAALCVLTACKKGPESLEVYTLEEGSEDTVVALDTILEEGEAILASIDAPTDVAVTEGLDLHHTYHYQKMHDPAELAGRYIALLMNEENGFTPIDGERHRLVDPPVTDTLIGSVALAKSVAASDDGVKRILRVLVGWSEYAVAVQVAYIDGTILPPVEEEKENDANDSSSGAAGSRATSVKEQTEYFNSLDPRKLGLEGESMLDYMIYPQPAWVKVDDVECREIMVYKMDPQTAVNQVVGTFFLSGDLSQVFKQTEDGQIVAVQID